MRVAERNALRGQARGLWLVAALALSVGWCACESGAEPTAGAIRLVFGAQSQPSPEGAAVYEQVLPGTGLRRISFRFMAEQKQPSAVQLSLHSAGSDRIWSVNATRATVGEWAASDVPLSYGAGWTCGPCASPALFSNDVAAVRLVEIHVARDGSGAVQAYQLEALEIETYAADRDNDGIPDTWEYEHHLSSSDRADAQLDSDGDGQTNLDEYLADTNPRDAESSLRIRGIRVSGDTVRVEWVGGTSAMQFVDRGEPGSPSWTNILVLTPPTAVTNAILDAVGPAGFYRVRASRP